MNIYRIIAEKRKLVSDFDSIRKMLMRNDYYENFISKYLKFAVVAIIAVCMSSTSTMQVRNDYSFGGMVSWSYKYVIMILIVLIPCTLLSIKRVHVTEEYIEFKRIFKKRYYYKEFDYCIYMKNSRILYLYTADKEEKIVLKHISSVEKMLNSFSRYIKIKNI